MRFQRNILAMAILMGSSSALFAAASKKPIAQLTVKEIYALSPQKLTAEQIEQLHKVAASSGLEHRRQAAGKFIAKELEQLEEPAIKKGVGNGKDVGNGKGSVTLKFPQEIAAVTGMSEVTLPLSEAETFTLETFGDLIDQKGGSLEIVTTFSQGSDGRWYAHHYDAESYRTHRDNGDGAEGDPVTGLPILHEHTSVLQRVK